jgi:hypothetical protein
MPGKLYPDDLAAAIVKRGGGKYRPSNGSEGEMFMERWCYQCVFDNEKAPCPIIAATMVFGIDEDDYPPDWSYDSDGQPQCTAFERRSDG